MSHPRLLALLLALVTLAIFLPVGQFDFINYDDPEYVTENVMVKNGLTGAGIEWAFAGFHAANWHPLTWLSHMLDCTLFGLNPAAHHFVNVLFHAANTALLFVLLIRLTGKTGPALLVAMLFAWHPLHVESVAWVAERKDVLSTFFALLALLSYTRFARENCRRSYWLTLGWFGCSLLAKPMFVTLPCLLLLLDFWPLSRWPKLEFSTLKKLLIEKTPFFLLVIPACIVTCLAQRGAMATLEHVPVTWRVANAACAYWSYLAKIFWPIKLAFFYPLAAAPLGIMLAAVAGLVMVSFGAWHWRRRYPFILVGWFWFLGTLVPVIGLVQVGEQSMADRYSYFPAIGIFIVVAFGGGHLAHRFPNAKKLLIAVGVLITVICIALTEVQLQFWRSDETLFTHAAAVTKNNEIAHLNLGVVYEKQGRTNAALAEYQTALKINPRREHTHNNLGDLLDLLGQPEAALAEYQAALALNPQSVSTYLNLGLLQVELGHFTQAATAFAQAAQLAPNDARPPYETGKLLLKQGRDAEAVAQLRHALELEPDNFKMLVYTAHVLAADETTGIRDGQTARQLANRANDLVGGQQPLVLDVLGMAFAESGDFTNAIVCVQKAIELLGNDHPQDAEKLKVRLTLYQDHQPWRESFRATGTSVKGR